MFVQHYAYHKLVKIYYKISNFQSPRFALDIVTLKKTRNVPNDNFFGAGVKRAMPRSQKMLNHSDSITLTDGFNFF